MIARGCAANGAHTILIDVNEQGLCETVEELQRIISDSKYSSLETHAIHGDLSSEDGVKEIVAKVKALQNPVDALIHCAGVRPASVHNHQFVPSYQTSKAAVDHLVRIMATEFADFYIRVNAISPGIVPSGMTTADASSNLHLAKEAPAGRAGNDEDMVGTALWLMSKAGSFMDGKVVRVEGGRLLILKGVTSNSD
ncbi:hypothetical protein N7468_003182 [Penicillium chermesinum]|uniref:Uncharacterized protein n=1 Tax=Penicillium chermesinum TaxID=63820 RepID=A0A9W9P5Z2_9EURO|nr:uncharacterized protein N7468_003182 [Penicillium chermesinum]KAJ5238563.1 hypothetical protein N7468_003182 [Penicillium chermesinum]